MSAEPVVYQCTRCRFSWLDDNRDCPVCENAKLRATVSDLLENHDKVYAQERWACETDTTTHAA
jgi:hypothetical protein